MSGPAEPSPVAADPGPVAADPSLVAADPGAATVEGSAPKPGPPPSAAQAADPLDASTQSVARNSAVMAAGSIVSRITGFVRTAAIGAAIGAGVVANDYNLAIALPNMVFELLVGGVLSSVIVPVLVRTRKRDADGGAAYTQRLLTLAVLALGAAAALATAAAPVFTAILTDGRNSAADQRLVTHLAYLILPAVFFYGMAALCGAILNSRGSFAAPMWTPILNNLVVIATAGALILIDSNRPTPESISTAQLLVLGLGTTLGIVVQASGLWPALRRVGFRWKWRFDFRSLGLGELGRLGAWMLLFVVVNQVGVFVVLKIAKLVDRQGAPSVTIFQNAFLIFMMAHGIVAVSVMTALMPRLSAAAADGRHRDLVTQMSNGIRLVAVVLVPITAAYVLLGQPLAVTLFAWGNFSVAEARSTGTVIAVAGFGLVPYAIMQLQQFAFYALRDTRTPALLNIPVVALRLGIDLVFYFTLAAGVVAAALMGGSAISFAAGAVLSFVLLRRRLGRLDMARVAATLLRLGAAALLAAVPTFLVGYAIERILGDGKLGSAVHLLVGGAVLVGCYVAAAVLLRVAEVRDLGRMVRARLGR
jgi:putative peptidoglycan lipid II flippase